MYNHPFFNGVNMDIYRNQLTQSIQQPYMPFNPYAQNMGNQPSPTPQMNLSIRRVSNIEEARAAMIDPMGVYFFADMGSGKIYMKQMKNDGSAEFYTFGIEQQVTSNETEVKNPLVEINQRLTNIEAKLGGIINVQSATVNGSAANPANAELSSGNGTTGHAKDAGSKSADVPEVCTDDEW